MNFKINCIKINIKCTNKLIKKVWNLIKVFNLLHISGSFWSSFFDSFQLLLHTSAFVKVRCLYPHIGISASFWPCFPKHSLKHLKNYKLVKIHIIKRFLIKILTPT